MDSLTATAQIEGLDTVLPLLEEARHEEALPLIEDKLAKQPDVPLWKYIKALVVACQARGGESVSLLSETSKLEGFHSGFGLPSDVNTLAKASALNHLQFETSVEPGAVEPWLHLEQVARLLDNSDFLTRAILGRWKANPEDEAAPRRFDQHFKEQSVDEKIKLLEEILEHDQEACLPRACLGYYMQEKGKTALAIRHLKKAHESQPLAWQPHLYLGRVFVSQGRFEDAENRFSEAIALRKQGSAELLAEMAHCQKATYRYEEALETYFEALQKYPSDFSHWNELFELAEATGASERLLQAVTKASQEQPDNLELSGRIIALALRSKDPLEARRKLQASGILQSPSKSVSLTVLACEVFLMLGQCEEAVRLLESALKSEPKSKELRTAFGTALLACDRAAEAEVILKETALNHPNERVLQVAWGRALLAIGEAERGHRAFAVASRLDPEDPEALAEQGRALLAMGQEDEAVTLLKESAKQSDPPNIVTLSALGAVYQAKGLRDISKDFFRQALSRDGGCLSAARGWLRMCDQNPRELKENMQELLAEKGSDFERSQFYLSLLHASLWEGLAESTKLLQQEILERVKASIKSPEYLSFLEENMIGRLPALAAKLEREGMFERAREAWRFAVTSSDSEISQKATAELLRLDTVHAALAGSQGNASETPELPSPEPVSATTDTPEPPSALESPVDLSGDDPLLSLLSSTLPVEQAAPAQSPESVPLFASPTSRPPEPSSPLEESPLFAEAPKSLFESSPMEDQLFAPEEEVQEEQSAQAGSHQGDGLEASLFTTGEVPEPTVPDLLSVSDPSPAPEAARSAEAQEDAVSETLVEDLSQKAALPEPEEALVPPTTSSSLSPPEDAPLVTNPPSQDDPSPPDSTLAELDTTPDTVAPEASPEPESSPRKELLPIPMAVDFEPLTRRQLHFHEALAQTQGSMLAPENIAHLMVCSSLGHEPPDPSSQDTDQEQQTLALQEALLSSAQNLANQEQYRGATRLLKTALLYAPDSPNVNGALVAVLVTWSSWLARSEEFAHSVSLLREASRRAPQTAGLEEQLEQTYQSWMTWSDEKGDPAARDLLAVYLQQEQASLQALRTAWKERSAQRATPAQASVQAVPQVEPTMPKIVETPPTASAPAIQDAPSPQAAPPSDSEAQAVPEVVKEPAVAASTEVEKEESSVAATAVASGPVEDLEIEDSPAEIAGTEQATSDPEAESAPKAAVGGFSSSEEALEALDADPHDKALIDAVFAYHADSMRNLTTALRDKASAHSDDPIWLLLLARAFRKSGSETMAVIQYQKYIKAAPTPEAYEELAMTYEEIGKEDFAKMTRRKAERAFSE